MLQVSQVEREPLDRFVAAVGVGHVVGPYPRRTSLSDTPIYRWQVTGSKAKTAMSALWPYLSTPKKEQYLQVLEKVECSS